MILHKIPDLEKSGPSFSCLVTSSSYSQDDTGALCLHDPPTPLTYVTSVALQASLYQSTPPHLNPGNS